jgi:hypothetical protein
MPLKIIETEKEGHRKVKTKEPKRYQGQKSDLYGTKTHKRNPRKSLRENVKGGRAGYNIGGRANLLEEMGRIDARKHPDAADRAEKRRVIGELNKGYKEGGRTGRPSQPRMMDKGPKGKKKGINIFVKFKGGEGPANRHDKIRKVNFSKGGRSGYNSGGAVLKGKKVGCQIK